MKPKLTIDEIIQDMEDKGITFKYVSESEAKDYLSNHTYYFKFKSYAKNYVKNPVRNKYSDLDFSYLQDLARLDMYFREIVFKITVDIEHLLRVQIMNASQNNLTDDGYSIVNDYLTNKNQDLNKYLLERSQASSDSGYNTALIKNNYPAMPIWVFLEVISFGELIDFYSYYTNQYPIGNNVSKYLWSARIMRNAAAHNSCILNRLTEYTTEDKVNYTLKRSIKKTLPYVSSKDLKKYQKNPVIQDFMDILMVFRVLDKSRSTLTRRLNDIDAFLQRCQKNKSYYDKNLQLKSIYNFICSFISEFKKSL